MKAHSINGSCMTYTIRRFQSRKKSHSRLWNSWLLVLALCLAAGIDGIKNKIQPDAELRENVFELTEQDKKRLGIESLPADLHEAVECLKSDDFIREILGEHIYDKYIEAKEAEWNDYRAAVTQWEIDEYLYKF